MRMKCAACSNRSPCTYMYRLQDCFNVNGEWVFDAGLCILPNADRTACRTLNAQDDTRSWVYQSCGDITVGGPHTQAKAAGAHNIAKPGSFLRT